MKSELCSRLGIALVVGAMMVVAPDSAFAWTVQKIKGQVSVINGKVKVPAEVGTVLKVGDTVETAADSKAMLQEGESEIWLAPTTQLAVHKLVTPGKSELGRFDILAGKLRAKFKKTSGPEAFPYEVRLKSVVAGVRGTEFFMAIEGDDEKVCTLEGLVRVTSLKSRAESWDVKAGKGLFIKPNEMPKVRDTTDEQVKKWIDISSF